MDTSVVQVTTAPSEVVAGAIASTLVDARLAACVQVLGPVRSRYWWDGAVEEATEWLCTAKTVAALGDDVVAAIIRAHPYDLPEVVVTDVVGGSGAYLDWIRSEVSAP